MKYINKKNTKYTLQVHLIYKSLNTPKIKHIHPRWLIMAPPVPMFFGFEFNPAMFIIETIVTLIFIGICFAIYFKTRESYELTKYEGLKYFRNAFLLFGISYILSFLSSIALFSRVIFGVTLPREIFGTLFILPLGYLSTMAILYLIYSTVWKKFENKKTMLISHIVAIILTITTFITRSHMILVLLQSILFILAIVLGLWLTNLFMIGRGIEPHHDVELVIQILSLGAYAFIYHKISKWVK